MFLKKLLVPIIKYSIAFAILGTLGYQAAQNDQFQSLTETSKNWGLLVSALLLALTAVLVSFARWHYLVRALELPFDLLSAFRLGFIGYLFNFLTLGIVGGDALKAIFVAKHLPGRKTEVVATVIIDRAIGLLALFIVCSVGFMTRDFSKINPDNPAQFETIQWMCRATLALAAIGLASWCSLFALPKLHDTWISRLIFHLPLVGPHFERLFDAALVYRKKPLIMIVAMMMSFGVHCLNTLAIFCVAAGLSVAKPDLATHFVVAPISMLAGAMPLPGGMGTFEWMLDFLYGGFSSSELKTQTGFVVALGFRVITLLIAAIGVCIYMTHKREVNQMVEEANE